MSGIFRHSAPTSNNNNSNETAPHKRISFGAFCTSPGALQDVTMDNAYGVGYRSPCVSMQHYHGASSPAVQGRSVREFEEHTAQLRKENFNLKLRLYFVEQNMPALKSNGGDGCDTVMRELIDHKVEVEMLRRELEEKQGVLKDALQAIEDLENIQKETETKYEAKLDDLKQKMQLLEMDRHAEKSENNELLNTMLGRSDIVTEHVNTLQKIRELEAQVKTHEETVSELQNKVDFFDSLLEKREKTIQEFEDKTKNLEYQNAELQEELDNCKKEIASSEHCKHEEISLGSDDFLQENHYREHMEFCLQEARTQNETINNLQAFLSMKSENSKRILERFKEYEKCVDKMREERNMEKGKNKFLCSIIKKLRQQIKEMSRVTAGLTKSEQIEHSYTVETFKRVTSTTKTQSTASINDQLNATYTKKSSSNKKEPKSTCVGEIFKSINQAEGGGDIMDGNDGQQLVGKRSNESLEGLQCAVKQAVNDDDEDEEDLDKLLANSIDLSSVFMETISAMKHQTSTPAASIASQKSSNYAWLEIQQYRSEIADKACTIDDLEEQGAEMRRKLDKAAQTIQSLKHSTKLLQNELKTLRADQQASRDASSLEHLSLAVNQKHTTISSSNAESKILTHSLSDTDAHNKADLTQRNEMQATIALQENMIKSLQAENKKKTADLQNLVNKELWEKNREIERLTKLINTLRPNSPIASATSPTVAVHELQQSFTEREYADALERNKQLQRKVEVLIQRLGAERENELLVTKLRHEIREARADAENAEKFRLECASACSVLTERLEELAGFLNSLLKNKDVLGLLAADRKRAMRKAIDRSLDLSKSLNRTLSITGVSLSEYSLSQLCNLSEILNDDNISVQQDETAASALNESKICAIETLRAENKALKKELDKRRTQEAAKKDRRSLPASVAVASLENQSESEAWSEPDRKVSMARMGLEDHSASLNISKELSAGGKQAATTDSESETDTGDAAQLNHSRSAKLRAQQQEIISQLERLVAQRDERILQVQCQLVEADNRLKKENLRVLDLTDEVRQLRERNEQLQTDLLAIGAADNNKHERSQLTRNESMWLHQIEEQSQLLERIEKERDRLDDEARATSQHVKKLKTQLDQERTQHAEKLHEAISKERDNLEEMRKAMNAVMQHQLEEQQQQQKETLAQLTELQRQYVEAQRSIDSHIENARELRQTLVESEGNARALKKQLNESALQASQAVMERTKALSEKLQLEQAMNDCKTMLRDMQDERDALQKRLEETQAALEQATLKEQTQRQKEQTQLNGSDISQSGYTSEEVAPLMRAKVSAAAVASNGVADANGTQRLNNSSPDLGIESDAGRVSSVELTNMHRSLLMKIELPSPHNSANKEDKLQPLQAENLDIENRPPNANAAVAATAPTVGASIVHHDCAKVEEENAELKRKLIRTKRQFEETYQKLKTQNQRKAQIEKEIKTQILKTHVVLKNVRSNLDNDK